MVLCLPVLLQGQDLDTLASQELQNGLLLLPPCSYQALDVQGGEGGLGVTLVRVISIIILTCICTQTPP